MEPAVERFEDKPPANAPKTYFRNSFNFPYHKQRWSTQISKKESSVSMAAASPQALPMQGQEPFDILE
jgi:hypothetical protein